VGLEKKVFEKGGGPVLKGAFKDIFSGEIFFPFLFLFFPPPKKKKSPKGGGGGPKVFSGGCGNFGGGRFFGKKKRGFETKKRFFFGKKMFGGGEKFKENFLLIFCGGQKGFGGKKKTLGSIWGGSQKEKRGRTQKGGKTQL